MKLSLCFIAGNVERYIERFIRSFAPLVDEVVMVRAVGFQQADHTLEIATGVCDALGLPFISREYRNSAAHAEWPHVDDFAAARNESFAAASHEWVVWADTDDIIGDASIATIKSAIQNTPDTVVAYALHYNVPEDGLSVWKERIIRRGSARWIHPIHEALEFGDDAQKKIVRIPGATFEHRPDVRAGRVANDERNARILDSIPADQRTTGQAFHLFQSWRALGRMADAARLAVETLTQRSNELKPPEKYELMIALAQMNQQPEGRADLLLQAIGLCPERREAYGEMALTEIALDRPVQMLAWTRAMLALPRPEGYIWNQREMYYGWCGVNLHAMALRANGDNVGGDVHEINHLKRHGAAISLLHATRGRPEQAARARTLWLKRAADPDSIEHIFAMDADDEKSGALVLYRHVVQFHRSDSVGAWNLAAAASHGKILVQLNDDFDPPVHWDRMLIDAFGGCKDPAVLRVSDGHRTDDLLCLAVMNRARYKQQGYFLHPKFKSVFSDNYHSFCAFRDNCIIDARHIVIHHHHPFFNNGQGWDEIYAAHNSPDRYAEGAAIYEHLTGQKVRTVPPNS
jgi:hypothetical protein